MDVDKRLVQAARDVNAKVVAAALRSGAVKIRFARELGVTRTTLDAWQRRGEEVLGEGKR